MVKTKKRIGIPHSRIENFQAKKAIRTADFGRQSVSVILLDKQAVHSSAYLSHQTTLENVLVPPWRERASRKFTLLYCSSESGITKRVGILPPVMLPG